MVDLTVANVNPADTYKVRVVLYLSDRTLADVALEDACKKENKTIDGVMNYVYQEAQKVATNCANGKAAWVDDDVVWGWAVHYILEDSLDCEPKKVEPRTYNPSDAIAKLREATANTTIKGKKTVVYSSQLTFDFGDEDETD